MTLWQALSLPLCHLTLTRNPPPPKSVKYYLKDPLNIFFSEKVVSKKTRFVAPHTLGKNTLSSFMHYYLETVYFLTLKLLSI